ncbi:MAG: ATP-dependent helicase [Thiomonas sp.]|uniref:ATP-dependent helicase n=1 Tax=Thiomonas sp. TaxID=2047785 RepID=UPI002A363DC2|nr:ATP-dependent helicase [Thiomonas sp.]MDY0331797.1 ATP-dependent helicase [Thiomonas sp.]
MIRPEDWVPADGLTLEPNAGKAVRELHRSLALMAGPGAGKTEVLAQRADFLLRTGTCRYPRRILAISFKVDASGNLKDRVQRRCGKELASRFDSHTFHAFAKRLIDRFRPVLKGKDALDPNFTVHESKRIERKQITFNDMVPFAIQILENSQLARNAVRMTYTDIFLDEFQDCTNEQYRLIRTAFLGTPIRLTAVGDTKQRIMSWAGALEGVFEIFGKDFTALPLNLYSNFRSNPRLRRMQNDIVKVLDPPAVVPDDQLQGEKGEIYIKVFDNCQEEAEAVAELIVSCIEVDGLLPTEIAVLMSKQLSLYAGPLMAALSSRNIPYRNEQDLQDTVKEPLTRLAADFLTVLHNDCEPEAWQRLIGQISEYYYDDIPEKKQTDWSKYINTVKRELMAHENYQTDFKFSWELVHKFMKKIGKDRIRSLSAEYQSETRLQEIWKETRDKLEALVGQEGNIKKGLKVLDDDQAVRILTLHKSKGLEFDTVIFMVIDNQIFWGDEAENRCAYFVGVSRAKKRLYLTYAQQRKRPEGYRGRWNEYRTPQLEYLGYAEKYLAG